MASGAAVFLSVALSGTVGEMNAALARSTEWPIFSSESAAVVCMSDHDQSMQEREQVVK